MATLIVRNVDEAIVKSLKERAKRNGRSMEAEHRAFLQTAFAQEKMLDSEFERRAALLKQSMAGVKQTPSEVLLQEMRDDYAKPDILR